jgi:hypothetical protein
MELITALKQWFQEDLSGRINNIINILILLAIVTTCSKVEDSSQRIQKIQQQTSATIQPMAMQQPITDEQIQKMILDVMIAKLQEVQGEIKK